jgi:pantothenate kinase-related protein Tda10
MKSVAGTNYRIVYRWRGELHQTLRDATSREEANHLVAEMRANGWDAWAESYQPTEHAHALDALAVAVENVAASELGGGA